MEASVLDTRKIQARTLPPLRTDYGTYPVDVDASIASGYVTYGARLEKGEQTMAARAQEEVEVPVDTTFREEDVKIDTEIGTIQDLMVFRPSMSEILIPEIGKKFFIRTLDGREADAYRSSLIVGKGVNQTVQQRGMRAKLICLALANPDGTRMLTDKDSAMVQAWPAKILERLFDRARKFNGLVDDDTDGEDRGNS